MQGLLSLCLVFYFTVFAFEGVVRYGLNLVGADELIFVRDAVLALPLLLIFIQQALRGEVHAAYKIFFGIVLLHGLVMMINIGSLEAVVYSAKVLMTALAGALAARWVLQPSRSALAFLFLLWTATIIGIVLDKYFFSMPWMGLMTTIGDFQVDIGRDWEIPEGPAKRAAGFMRSSIHAAFFVTLVSLVLMFHLRRRWLKVLVALLAVPTVYLTTQKAATLAFALVVCLLFLARRKPVPLLRLAFLLLLLLSIVLPVALPGYHMPHAEGQFSMSSFNTRVEEVWPDAWDWIARHEAFPFGVGLGGIGGAQRFYAPEAFNPIDNMFIFLYGQFGVMAFVYMGWLMLLALRLHGDSPKSAAHALTTLAFLFGFGCMFSLIEDQMGTFFLGASAAWLAYEVRQQRRETALVPGNLAVAA